MALLYGRVHAPLGYNAHVHLQQLPGVSETAHCVKCTPPLCGHFPPVIAG